MAIQPLNYYSRQVSSILPNDIIPVCARSFLVTGTMTLLSGTTLTVASITGALAVTTTLVESAVRHIFNKTFPNCGFDKKNWTTWAIAYIGTEESIVNSLQSFTGARYTPIPQLTLLGFFFICTYDSRPAMENENMEERRMGAQAYCL